MEKLSESARFLIHHRGAVGTLAFYATPPATPAAHRTSVFDTPLGELKSGGTGGMEGDEQQRRQYEQPSYPQRGFAHDLRPGAQGSNVPEVHETLREAAGGDGSERYRHSQLLATRTPTSASMAVAGGNAHLLGGFGYTQGQPYTPPHMQGSSMQYQAEYPQESQRQQQFPQYASQMMYSVPQQAQPQSPYEAVQQYQPRQSAAIEVLSSQFGVPPYYNPGEPTSAPGPTTISQQYAPAQFQQPVQYQAPTSLGRSNLQSSYPTGMAEFAQPAAPDVLEPPNSDASNFDQAYSQYQEALKQTFENARVGRLVEASESLLEISEWLLGHAVDLGTLARMYFLLSTDSSSGLVRDDQGLHAERTKLWDEFNTCWLAVLQRQKDDTQRVLDSGREPNPPQSIVSSEVLGKMATELIRLCDGMEKHGLVDYQMGVWEEEILSGKCLGVQS